MTLEFLKSFEIISRILIFDVITAAISMKNLTDAFTKKKYTLRKKSVNFLFR